MMVGMEGLPKRPSKPFWPKDRAAPQRRGTPVGCSASKANRINAYFRVPLYSQQQGAWVEMRGHQDIREDKAPGRHFY